MTKVYRFDKFNQCQALSITTNTHLYIFSGNFKSLEFLKKKKKSPSKEMKDESDIKILTSNTDCPNILRENYF